MPEPGNPRILYLALCTGASLTAAVLAVLRQMLPGEPVVAPDVMRYVAAALIAGGLLSFRALRSRIEPLAVGGDEGAWWRVNLGRAVIGWALAEAVVLAGGVFYFLTADPTMLGVVAAGFVLLWVLRPARLLGL